ncbi:MAG: serine protease [Methanobacterium sp.]|nr:serine protease [Methanobacterium sp.]
MRWTKSVLFLIILISIVISGMIITENILGTTLFSQPVEYSNQAANSTAYIQNGVSGIVILTDPTLNQTVKISVDYYPLDSGSGVVVTHDGYIITAFHVIGDPRTLKSEKQLKKMTDDDIKYYVEEAAVGSYILKNPQLGEALTGSELNIDSFQVGESTSSISESVNILNQRKLLNVSSYKQVIKVVTPSMTNFTDAELVDVGDASADEDVALLKINADDLSSLAVSSQKPQYRQNIRIYGYPMNGNQTNYQKDLTNLNPSSATGFYISELNRDDGVIYYQTTAQVSEGYSGGPVINEENNLLGIVIYNINRTSKIKFPNDSKRSVFLSAQSIIEICKKNNVPINIV